ncbi:MAG: M48 family metallopeptidase [Oscillospiraceae bacterium]
MNEKRSVDCGGDVVEYTLARKKVKNINMRVKADGSVGVSAPSRVSAKFIDDFVRSRYDFIKTSAERLSAESKGKLPEFDDTKVYADGDVLSLLGEKLTVEVIKGSEDRVFVSDEKLVIETFDMENTDYIQKLLRNFFYNSTVVLFKELNDGAAKLFGERFGIGKVPIKLRKMKSRWGSCHVTDGFIVMNTRLISYPKECARYVFIHEYSHFIEANHSPRFYAVVSSVMPDYKIYADMLK